MVSPKVVTSPYNYLVVLPVLSRLLNLLVLLARKAAVRASLANVAIKTAFVAMLVGSAARVRRGYWIAGTSKIVCVVLGEHDVIVCLVRVFVFGVFVNPIDSLCDIIESASAFEGVHSVIGVVKTAPHSTHKRGNLILKGSGLLEVPLVMDNSGSEGVIAFDL